MKLTTNGERQTTKDERVEADFKKDANTSCNKPRRPMNKGMKAYEVFT